MQTILGFLAFYKRIIIPTFVLALLLFVILRKPLAGAFVLGGVLFHFYIYEIMYPKEYYFYHNLGLSKWLLWAATIGINVLFDFILVLL